jgi:hypothetical protein
MPGSQNLYVQLIIRDANLNAATATKLVYNRLLPPPCVGYPIFEEPFISETPVATIETEKIMVHPNPAAGLLYFSLKDQFEGNFSIYITDSEGNIKINKSYKSDGINQNYTLEEIQKLSAGVYILNLTQKGLLKETVRFIKK